MPLVPKQRNAQSSNRPIHHYEATQKLYDCAGNGMQRKSVGEQSDLCADNGHGDAVDHLL
jgi:hypothetical protein